MTDPFTMTTQLCDDDGMVSHEIAFQATMPPALTLTYLDVHNNLRAHTRGADKRVTEPFHCTGSAHLAGEHIRCNSPAHGVLNLTALESLAAAAASPPEEPKP